MILNCEKMGKRELNEVFQQFLLEFPLTRVIFHIPGWAETLEEDHWLKHDLFQSVKKTMEHLNTVRDIYQEAANVTSPYVRQSKLEKVDLADGTAEIGLVIQDALYLSDPERDDEELISEDEYQADCDCEGDGKAEKRV